MMKLFMHKSAVWGFLVTIIILITLGIFSYTSIQRLIDTAQLQAHTSYIINNAEQIIKIMVDFETGQRGFVITSNEEFLEPYYESAQVIDDYLNTLDSLTDDNPHQKASVILLRKAIHTKLTWSKSVVATRRESFEKARDMVSNGFGKQITDSIRSLVTQIQDEERKIFQQGNTLSDESLQQFQYSFISLAITGIAIIGYLFYIINRMMGKRNEVEDRLRHIADETRDLYNNAPCGYLSVGPDIRFTNVNQTLLNWLGYAREEVIGSMKFEDFLSPESKALFTAGFVQDFDKFKRDGFVNDLEFDFQRKDGTTIPVLVNSAAIFDSNGEFLKSRSTVIDNTVQRKSREIFKKLLEAAPDAAVIIDKQGTIQLINQQCEKLFEYSRQELIGQKVEVLLPKQFKDIHPTHRKNFFDKPTVRPMGEGLELLGLRKSGREFPVEISLSPIETESGLLISASIRDITERKRNEETILKLNRELESFTYSVSHDLRAPLRSIAGYTQILKEDYGPGLDPEALRVINVIINNASRMGQLIDDLLDFSRMGRREIQKDEVNMERLVQDVLNELTPQTQGRKLNIKVLPLAPARADMSMLRQVWTNLISNAFKYSSKNEVTEIEISSAIDDDKISYCIRDNGVGFDMQYVGKLFGVFQRLHKMNEFDGTGVGLALVKAIIERHEGRVWAEGKLGEGACFYFALPAHTIIET